MTVQVVSIPEYLSGAGLARLADLSTLPPITISFLPHLGDGTQST